MKIILKYKKIFIGVATLALFFSLIPVLSMFLFVYTGDESTKEPVLVDEYTSASNYLEKTPDLAKLKFIDGVYTETRTGHLNEETSVGESVFSGYLEEGTLINLQYALQLDSSSRMEFQIITEDGVQAAMMGIDESFDFEVPTSGNYGIVYNTQEATGTYDLTLTMQEPK